MPAATGSNNDRFLGQLEDMKRQQKHLERLRTIKSAVDNNSHLSIELKIDAKKLIRKRDKAEQIHKENMKILNKIASIVKRKNDTFHSAVGFRTHATVMRSKANAQIEKENNILFQRLQTISSKSVYSRAKFEKERQETEKHLKRISHCHQKELREHYIHKFLREPGYSPSSKGKTREDGLEDYETDFEDDVNQDVAIGEKLKTVTLPKVDERANTSKSAVVEKTSTPHASKEKPQSPIKKASTDLEKSKSTSKPKLTSAPKSAEKESTKTSKKGEKAAEAKYDDDFSD